MTPPFDQLRAQWEQAEGPFLRFPARAFQDVRLSPTTVRFLTEVGLPRQAAPFLDFEAPKAGRLPTADESFNLEPEFAAHYVLGTNGSGDPIVLAPDSSVIYLNHDADLAPVYMNKDVQTLAESLLRYWHLITETLRLHGPDAYLEGRVPPHLRTEFVAYLQAADPQAFAEDSMWAGEIASWADVRDD